MHKETILLVGVAALGYVLLRQGGLGLGAPSSAPAGGAPSSIIPRGAEGFLPPPQNFPSAVGMLRPGTGGYLFPTLPMGQAFTTDPSTGQVYVVEQGVPVSGGYISLGDITRR